MREATMVVVLSLAAASAFAAGKDKKAVAVDLRALPRVAAAPVSSSWSSFSALAPLRRLMNFEASWLSRTVLASVKQAFTVNSSPMTRNPRVQLSTGSHTMPVRVVPNERTNEAHDWNTQASVSRAGGIGSQCGATT